MAPAISAQEPAAEVPAPPAPKKPATPAEQARTLLEQKKYAFNQYMAIHFDD